MNELAVAECTRFTCWLEEQGGMVSFPLVTIAGLVDGLNPCAIGMMVLLLGYLLLFNETQDQQSEVLKKMVIHGTVYIVTIFLTYFVIGFGLYSFALQLQQLPIRGLMYQIIGWGLIIAGLIQAKDVVRPDLPIHLRIPSMSKGILHSLIQKASIPTVIALGVLVTLLETPCSLPIYVGTATILANSGLPLWGVVGYFLYYNFLFVLPLILVLLVTIKMRQVVMLKEMEHRYKSWMHAGLAIVLFVLGIILLL